MRDASAVHLSASARLVAEALAAADRSTVLSLVDSAGVSKSTVAKTLAVLERCDAATRTVREEDGIREADLWSPGPALGAVLVTADAGSPGYDHATVSATATETAAGPQPSDVPVEVDVAAAPDGNTATAFDPGKAEAECAVPEPDPATEFGEPADLEQQHVPANQGLAHSDSPAEAATNTLLSPGGTTAGKRAERLAPGELAAMVAAVVTAHPDVEYTPAMLSHMLGGRSPGAIQNALEKMVKTGGAARTCDKPKRYRHASPQGSNGS